jgi:MarR family transcriptional regulator, organic hydroperoxide resistance regulator
MSNSPSTTADVLCLENQLCFALYSASRLMTKAYRPLLSKLGITYPQYLVFLVLWEQQHTHQHINSADSITVRALGQRLLLDSGTLTPLLKRMEQDGWLERRKAKRDEREVHLVLTEKGITLREQAKDIPRQLLCQSNLELSEIIGLRDQVKGLIARLQSPSESEE